MLQLQSSRNKILHDWKKQKEPNFLQKNKLALKQNAKQASLRTNGASKSQIIPKETSKKSSISKPPLKGTSKSSTRQQQQQQQQSNRVTGEDSVVISKSALDNLLKQLVDAKHAANILPPIGNRQEDSIAPDHQGDNSNEVSTTNQQKAINHTEPQKQWQHDSKHKELDYADVPGLSSSKTVAPQTTRDSSVGEHSSVPHEKRNRDAGQIYFPFGLPGGGAPNRPYHSNQTEGMSVIRVDSERHRQLSTTVPTSKHSPQDPLNISPRQHQSDITTHVKSVHLDEWQIREKESKRRQNLEHYEFVRAQIAEKERKKEEARQRKALEERLEEERIAKQLEKLQREYQEEQERIRRKEEELARRNALMYQKIQEAKSTALEVKHKSKLSPPFNQNNNINVPAIVEEQHYSDYDSSADDPDSRTNLDQVKVRLSFDSALRSPSMCNVIPDNSQGQEQSSSPRKHTVKSKSKSSVHQESVQSKGLEVGRQKKTRQRSTSKHANATGTQKEASHVPHKNRERKPSKIPIPTKELLKNVGNEEVVGELKQRGAFKHKERIKEASVHTQKGHRVSRNKVEKASTNQGTLATQQNSHVRSNSPPVPALAKKLEKTTVNSTAKAFSQPTDHFLPSLSTRTSKRARQKAAEKLNSTSEETLGNPVQQPSLKTHQQQYHKPVSPPVPALAKKLQQAQSLHKSSLTEFDSHNRSILPPISDTSETDLKGTFTPVQHVLSPVGYSGQPVTEFKSNSPPVPALAKQLNQQQPHTLNCHIKKPHPAADIGLALAAEDHKRPMSPELDSESQFTYLPEMEGGSAQATNHERHGLQPTQPIIYIPVSAHQFQLSSPYSQSSSDGLVCINNSQQMLGAAPQILSPVQIMVPSFSQSPSQLHHQQADVEQRKESSNATLSDEDLFQQQHTNSELTTTMHLSVKQQDNLTDSKLLHLPSIMAIAVHNKIENEDKEYDPVWSSSLVTATPQMSQQKEEVLQHLAMMKKRLLAQQQSITKRRSSSLHQSSNKLPPLS